jgi:arylsulfatase
LVPWVERITADGALPDGRLQIRYQQVMQGRPFDGSGMLFVNGKKVAEHKFERCLLSTSYDGVSVGADLGNQVSTAYQGPTPFQGVIERVQIRIDARPSSVMEMARFMRELSWRQ